MFNRLIIDVFNKAKQETQSNVLTHHAVHITDFLWEEDRFQINERTLRNYYREATSKPIEDNLKLSPKITQLLCRYLGYNDYQNFINSHSLSHTVSKQIFGHINQGIIILLSILCVFLFLVNLNFRSQINQDSKNTLCSIADSTNIETLILKNSLNTKASTSYKIIKIDSATKLIYSKTETGDYEFYSLLKAQNPQTQSPSILNLKAFK